MLRSCGAPRRELWPNRSALDPSFRSYAPRRLRRLLPRIRSRSPERRDESFRRSAFLNDAAFLDTGRPLSEVRQSDVGLVFSPGGFLVSYYLGVMDCLTELEVVDASTPICGTSAGALLAAFAVSELSTDACCDIVKRIQAYLLENGYGWKVIDVLRDTLAEVMPGDVHLKATGRLGIGVTCYDKRNRSMTGRVLTDFETRDEFLDAVAASCYIPYYLGPRLGVEWSDGCVYSDGMPTKFFPEVTPLSPLFRDETLTISALPRPNRRLFDRRDVDISPDLRQPSDVPSVWKVIWNGLVPLRTEEVESYRNHGYSDARIWAECSSSAALSSAAATFEHSLLLDVSSEHSIL